MTDDKKKPAAKRLSAPLRGSLHERASFELSVKRGRPNYGFVALAIGRWAHRRQSIPQWALDACADLYERSEKSPRVLVGPAYGPSASKIDAEHLERIADLFVDPDLRAAEGFSKRLSVRAAAMHVVGGSSDADLANAQRLQRIWSIDGERRKDRARKRLHKKLKAKGFLK